MHVLFHCHMIDNDIDHNINTNCGINFRCQLVSGLIYLSLWPPSIGRVVVLISL